MEKERQDAETRTTERKERAIARKTFEFASSGWRTMPGGGKREGRGVTGTGLESGREGLVERQRRVRVG